MTTTRTAPNRPTAGDGRPAIPVLDKSRPPLQAFGSILPRPIGLDEQVCQASVQALNQLVADTINLRDLYKKAHWHVTGPHFYQLHLLFDKHYEEQAKLVDELAERVQMLGGVSLAMGADAAEVTKIPRPPRDREDPTAVIARLLEAHQIILKTARKSAEEALKRGDDGTNDLLVSDVVRTNEMQVWFLSEHLVPTPSGHSG
jgi:starvation-inducible DNA-binding protein